MKRIIITVGPSLLYKYPITKIHHKKYIYRINGAHGNKGEIEKYIKEIRSQIKDAEILIDLPGNKIRTSNLEVPIELKKDETFILTQNQINFPEFYQYIKHGDIVWANDSTLKFTVKDISEKKIKFLSHSDGILENNKGLHVKGVNSNLPFLFEKDFELIEIANKFNIDFIGLSFVRNKNDIEIAKKYLNKKIRIISKVETLSAVKNLNSILELVEYILVDRGDLSTEVGITKIANYQSYIVNKALFFNKKVFLATQFLKNMEEKPIPTIAEIIDLYNTFKSGVWGIQLSEETAVGKFPYECLNLIENLLKDIEKEVF